MKITLAGLNELEKKIERMEEGIEWGEFDKIVTLCQKMEDNDLHLDDDAREKIVATHKKVFNDKFVNYDKMEDAYISIIFG